MFRDLHAIYEPSAIQQLPDGRFLVVEDEKSNPLSLVTLGADGSTRAVPLATEGAGLSADLADLAKLDDLEGIAVDAAGFVYVITSHSLSGKGERKQAREKLVRFRVEQDRIVAPVVVKGLKNALSAAHPALARAAEVLDVKSDGGLNIEALEMSPDQQRLLIGLRSPLLNGRALIAALENPVAVFESGADIQIAASLITLDLAGDGIRGMSYSPAHSGYLLISGPVAKQQLQFKLWFWSGRAEDAPRHVTVSCLAGFEHAEGVTAATIDGRSCIVIVSDDGSRDAGRAGRYLVLDPAQLQLAP